MVSVDQQLKEARESAGIVVVQWERRRRFTVLEVMALNYAVALYSSATKHIEFKVVDDNGVVQYLGYDGVAEQDLDKVKPGAVLWEVESLEDNACKARQHCCRWLFETPQI